VSMYISVPVSELATPLGCEPIGVRTASLTGSGMGNSVSSHAAPPALVAEREGTACGARDPPGEGPRAMHPEPARAAARETRAANRSIAEMFPGIGECLQSLPEVLRSTLGGGT